MAIPALVWRSPVGHKLNNDLVVVSDKFGTSGTFAAGQPNASKSGKYMVAMNDVDRSDTAFSPAVESPASPAVPAHSTYTYTDRGHISLNGGVYELLPFSAGVKGGTVTYTDFGGSGRSPYPESYSTLAPGTSNNPGVPICGTENYQNVESQHTYTTGTPDATPTAGGTYSTAPAPTNGTRSGDGTSGNQYVYSPASFNGPEYTTYTGAHSGPSTTVYTLTGMDFGTGGNCPGSSCGWTTSAITAISEIWTIGGTYQNGTSAIVPHKGSIHFKVAPDTECEIISGNSQKTVNGIANWANGQSRTVTVTAEDHELVDANNRIYIRG